jgi:hypothetical protein
VPEKKRLAAEWAVAMPSRNVGVGPSCVSMGETAGVRRAVGVEGRGLMIVEYAGHWDTHLPVWSD